MTKKIALFFGNFNVGGVQKVRLHLAKGFLDRGFLVDVVVVNAKGELHKQVPEGVAIIDLGAQRALSAIPALIRYLHRNNPDALLSAQTNHNIVAVMAHFLSRTSTRLVVGEHNNLQEVIKYAPFLDRLRPIAIKILYPYADRILAVSNGVADALSSVSGINRQKIQVIYNPIDLSDIRNKALGVFAHPWLQQKDRPVILAIGSLTAQKDFSTLIKAVAAIRDQEPIRLLILGEGRDRHKLQTMLKTLNLADDVDMVGFVANPYAYLARADIFVLSSRWEGFPNVLLEALAVGTPVVSTDCPSGPSEMLENGRYGHLVPVGDEGALADAIRRTLIHPPSINMLKKRASAFSLDAICEQYLQLLLKSNENNTH